MLLAEHNLLPKPARWEMVDTAMDFVASGRVIGSYMEFGVYRGNTFAYAYRAARRRRLRWMNFFAFDSFEGLPQDSVKQEGWNQFTSDIYAYPEDAFLTRMEKLGVNTNRIHVVKGWFDRTLSDELKAKLPIEKVAIANIDCDLYASTVPVLKWLTSLLQEGTLLLFDDWFCFKGRDDKGEQRAVKEWLNRNPHIVLTEYRRYGWHGNSFIVHFRGDL